MTLEIADGGWKRFSFSRAAIPGPDNLAVETDARTELLIKLLKLVSATRCSPVTAIPKLGVCQSAGEKVVTKVPVRGVSAISDCGTL